MATVFMKWLETRPRFYDRGIQLLTLGRLRPLKERIARDHVQPGMSVLEIGCGTGTLAVLMAERGAVVTAVDASPTMLAEAEKKAREVELAVTFHQLDATLIGERLPAKSFDLIVATLLFSELGPNTQGMVLENCARLLAPGARLMGYQVEEVAVDFPALSKEIPIIALRPRRPS